MGTLYDFIPALELDKIKSEYLKHNSDAIPYLESFLYFKGASVILLVINVFDCQILPEIGLIIKLTKILWT